MSLRFCDNINNIVCLIYDDYKTPNTQIIQILDIITENYYLNLTDDSSNI
jgi:hypothetical protein